MNCQAIFSSHVRRLIKRLSAEEQCVLLLMLILVSYRFINCLLLFRFQVVLLLSCILAFFLNYSIFLNTTLNSALTQTICGNLKVWSEVPVFISLLKCFCYILDATAAFIVAMMSILILRTIPMVVAFDYRAYKTHLCLACLCVCCRIFSLLHLAGLYLAGCHSI